MHSIRHICIIFHCDSPLPRLDLQTKHHNTFMIKKLFFLSLITLGCIGVAKAQLLPDRTETLNNLIKVNDYFMKKYADYTAPSYRGKLRPSHIWTRGVYYEGLMALHTIFPRDDYYEYAYNWGEFHKWQLCYGTTSRHADSQCSGQTYVDLYNICKEPQILKNVKANIDMVINTPQVNDWTWIDAIQMAMPIYAKLGKMTGDQRYFDKMWDMYCWSRNVCGGKGLYNAKDGLWWRDADFVPPYKEPNGEDCYWSRGNGWVYAALIRVLEEIPATEKHRIDYINDFLSMSKALKKCQRKDGFWNVSLHDENNFGGKESSGTALFIYGMAWGVRNGLLDRNEYLPIILKSWNAMVKDAVHPDGCLGFVQGTGKEPKDGQPVGYDNLPDFEDYGIGCFLLAGSEVYKLN